MGSSPRPLLIAFLIAVAGAFVAPATAVSVGHPGAKTEIELFDRDAPHDPVQSSQVKDYVDRIFDADAGEVLRIDSRNAFEIVPFPARSAKSPVFQHGQTSAIFLVRRLDELPTAALRILRLPIGVGTLRMEDTSGYTMPGCRFPGSMTMSQASSCSSMR